MFTNIYNYDNFDIFIIMLTLINVVFHFGNSTCLLNYEDI